MPVSKGPKTTSNGLVTAFDTGDPISYPGSGTTLYNIGKRNNQATLTNGPTHNTRNQGVIQLDPTSDYIAYTGMPTGTTWTMQLWFLIDGVSTYAATGHRTYIATDRMRFQWDDRGTNNAYVAFIDFGVSGTYQTNLSPTNFRNIPESEFCNRWHMVTATSDGSIVKIYYDKTEGSSSLTSTRYFSTNGVMRVGIDGVSGIGGSDLFNRDGGSCYIGPVKIYDRALTISEVIQNYNAQKSRFGL